MCGKPTTTRLLQPPTLPAPSRDLLKTYSFLLPHSPFMTSMAAGPSLSRVTSNRTQVLLILMKEDGAPPSITLH